MAGDRNPAASKTGFIVLLGAGVAAAALAGALDLASRLRNTPTSAQSFVAGKAIARGNLLLSGGACRSNDYYFTDTIPYAALEWLVGPRPFSARARARAHLRRCSCVSCLLSASSRESR